MIGNRMTAILSAVILTVAIASACRDDVGREPIISKDVSTDKDTTTTLDLKRVGFVNDYVNLLDVDARNRLETRLRTLRNGSDVEFVIVIIDSLNGQNLEDYSNNLIRSWRLDTLSGNDKKIVLVIDMNHQEFRTTVTNALWAKLPNEAIHEYERNITSGFSEEQYEKGLSTFVDAIEKTL